MKKILLKFGEKLRAIYSKIYENFKKILIKISERFCTYFCRNLIKNLNLSCFGDN